MTNKKDAGKCFQCGKPRIVVKVEKEYFHGSLVTTTETDCSDPECQKKTETLLKKELLRREQQIGDKEKRNTHPNKKFERTNITS